MRAAPRTFREVKNVRARIDGGIFARFLWLEGETLLNINICECPVHCPRIRRPETAFIWVLCVEFAEVEWGGVGRREGESSERERGSIRSMRKVNLGLPLANLLRGPVLFSEAIT